MTSVIVNFAPPIGGAQHLQMKWHSLALQDTSAPPNVLKKGSDPNAIKLRSETTIWGVW
jgi:hypothetical protein